VNYTLPYFLYKRTNFKKEVKEMAGKDFKYIINTELKLNTGSLKKLLEDVKDVDTSIRNHFNKTGKGGIKLPISIDKGASLNNLQSEVKAVITNFNRSQAPKIKIKMELDNKSAEALKQQVDNVKHHLNNINNSKENVNIKTSLKVDKGEKEKVQKQVGDIKATMTVGLKIDQNDLRVVKGQIESLRQEVVNTSRTRTTRNGEVVGSFRDHVNDRTASVGSRSTADKDLLNAKAQAQAEKDMASARRQNAQAQKTELQVEQAITKEKEKQAKLDRENTNLFKMRDQSTRRLTKAQDTLTQLESKANGSNWRTLSTNDQKALSGQLDTYRKKVEKFQRERDKIDNAILNQLPNNYYNRKPLVDPMNATRGRVVMNTNSNVQAQIQSQIKAQRLAEQQAQKEIERAHKQADALNRKYDQDRARQQQQARRDAEWNGAVHRYGGNRQKTILDDEMVLRNPDASKNDKLEALERLKQNAGGLAREMNQNLTRSFEVFNRNADGTISRTRTAQYEFTRFGDAVDRSNKFMSTLRNTMQYAGITTAFMAMGQGIQIAVQSMIDFEAQMSRIQLLTTDLRDGGLNQAYSGFGYSKNNIKHNTRRDVSNLSQKYGMSATDTVMPVYQQVMARSELIKGNGDKPSPVLANKITDQILKYSAITLGPNAGADDVNRISQDMLSLYQGLYKGKGQQHVYDMDRFVDFMTLMNGSGVNTNNIMDAMSEVAPDAIKKGIDPRRVAGMLGAYNLSDSDSSGSNMTTVAKTFFGGLARYKDSESIQSGLKTLGIDTTQNYSQEELLDLVVKNYKGLSDTQKESVSRDLSSVNGKGISQAPKIQKFLDASGSEYAETFKKNMTSTGLADNALDTYLKTAKVQFGQLKQELTETVELLAELGALDGLKALLGGFKVAVQTVNGFLDIIVRLGDASEKIFGFNIPKYVTQILALAGAFKLVTATMKKFQLGTGLLQGGSSLIGALTQGEMITRASFNGRTQRKVNVEVPHTGKGSGVGNVIGQAVGWVLMGGNPFKRGANVAKAGEVGGNVATNLFSKLGTSLKGLLPILGRFAGILLRLSAIGAVIGTAVWVGKKLWDMNQKHEANVRKGEFKNFNKVYGGGEEDKEKLAKDLNTWKDWNDKNKTVIVSRNGSFHGNPMPSSEPPKKNKMPKEIEKLQKQFSEMGITYSTVAGLNGNNTSTIAYNAEGKDGKIYKQHFNADDKGGWKDMIDTLGAKGLDKDAQIAEKWKIANNEAIKYQTELGIINDLTEKFNRTMNRLGYDMSKIDFNFMGAENSSSASIAKINLINGAMSDLSGTITELTDKGNHFKEQAGIYDTKITGQRNKIIKGGLMSKAEMDDLDQTYKLAYDSGNADTITNQYEVTDKTRDKLKKAGMSKKDIEKELAKRYAVSEYLSYKQSNAGFVDADKETEAQILQTNMAILERQQALKQLTAQLLVSQSQIDVFNAKISAIQFGTGKAKTLLDLSNTDEEKIKRSGDLLKSQSTELSAYRAQLNSVYAQMSRIKAQNGGQDFSIDTLYNPGENGLSAEQNAYKQLLEQQYSIHDNINSTTVAMKEQADQVKEMVLNSDKYADVWERVQNRIQLVKDLNNEIASIKTDLSLVNNFSNIRSAVTGGSYIQDRNSRLEGIRDRGLDGYEKIMTSLKTYAGDEQKLVEAYDEINKSMGGEFDNAFIQPLKDLIQNDFTKAGNLISDGAGKLDQVLTYWANNITSGLLTQQSQNFQSDLAGTTGTGGSVIPGFTGGINTKNATDAEKLDAYITQQFGYKKGTREFNSMKKQMQASMTPAEIKKEVNRGTISVGNNKAVADYTEKINSYFSKTGRTKLQGTGNMFVQAGAKYGIDPMFLASIAVQETGGKSGVINGAYNVGNIKGTGKANAEWNGTKWVNPGDGLTYRKYGSLQLGINDLARLLKDVYISQGYDTIPKINSKYAEDPNWKYGVASIYSSMSGTSKESLLGGTTMSALGGGGGTSVSSSYGTIRKGSKGASVKELQKALGVNADGIFGSATEKAVKSYQKSHGLTADGIVGSKTWSSLGIGGGSSSSSTSGVGKGGMAVLNSLVNKSASQGGLGYSWGGGHDKGDWDSFIKKAKADCSGLVQHFYREFAGVELGTGSSNSMWQNSQGKRITNKADLQVGDVVYFGSGGKVTHTGIYAGNGQYIGMNSGGPNKSGAPLKKDALRSDFVGGKRYDGANARLTSGGSVAGALGADVPTVAQMIKTAFGMFKEAIEAEMAINNVATIKESYNKDKTLGYGHGNIRDVLGTTGRLGAYDRNYQAREEIYDAKYGNVEQMKALSKTRAQYVKDANSALKAGKTDEYNANKEAVSSIDKLIATLKENNKKLDEWDKELVKALQGDPRYNASNAGYYIKGGYNKLATMQDGTTDYYRTVEELNGMNNQYMTTKKRLSVMGEFWNTTGLETGHYNAVKRKSDQEDINVAFVKLKEIQKVLNSFAQGTQNWYSTLEDVVAVYQELRELDEKRLENAKAYFEMTGQGAQTYINQQAYLNSKSYSENRRNLNVAKQTLTNDKLKRASGAKGMDENQQLATLQIIAGLQDALISQMNEYRQAVIGAFKAGAMSIQEYIDRMSDLRDVQNEQKENALKMIDSISQGFEQSLSNALASGFMGNMDSTQGFIDGIKQTLATTIASQLSATLLNNTGLQKVINDLITSVTTAATTGNPDDIANMFNNNNFGDQINNALAPFLPLIEQIVASTDGIFSIMKDQLFNAPQGFKIDQYLYDQAKGKSFEGVKNWQQNGETNEAGSPIGGVGSNTPIVTPPGTTPGGVPGGTSKPPTGTPGSTGGTPNTGKGGAGAPDSGSAVKNPTTDNSKVNTPPKSSGGKGSSGSGHNHGTVNKGDRGEAVKEIQRAVGVKADGIFGSDTERAVKAYQKKHGLKADGVVGKDTWAVIHKGNGGSSSGSKGNSNSGSKGTTKTTKQALNFRSSPGGKVMSVLPKGAKVNYLGMEKGWAKVSYKGKTGYVGKDYIYHTGGIAGMMNFANGQQLKANEIQAIMQKGEIALQPKQLATLLGNTVPKATAEGNGAGININVNVTVEGGDYDQKGIEKVVETSVEKAMTEFKRQQRLGNLSWKGTSY
jgi:peptidoglycan hydrolase-like protein with peptidoglycan-binding domain